MRLALFDRVTGIAVATGFIFPGWRPPRGLQQRRVQRRIVEFLAREKTAL
jgi:hypothetical protein